MRIATRLFFALAAPLLLVGPASATPILEYSFPASWDDSVPAVVDLSSAGNDGTAQGGSTTSATIPPGAPAGTLSLLANTGGINTNAIDLLDNPVVQAAGGFQMSAQFLWDGGETTFSSQKVVDYAGTEAIQVEVSDATAGTADVVFLFNDADRPVSFPIVANTWYDVVATFIVTGTSGTDLNGTATLTLNGSSSSAPATKTTTGDDLNRPIGIGQLGLAGTALVELQGLIYNPSVRLVPEPGSCLLMLSGIAVMAFRRR